MQCNLTCIQMHKSVMGLNMCPVSVYMIGMCISDLALVARPLPLAPLNEFVTLSLGTADLQMNDTFCVTFEAFIISDLKLVMQYKSSNYTFERMVVMHMTAKSDELPYWPAVFLDVAPLKGGIFSVIFESTTTQDNKLLTGIDSLRIQETSCLNIGESSQ